MPETSSPTPPQVESRIERAERGLGKLERRIVELDALDHDRGGRIGLVRLHPQGDLVEPGLREDEVVDFDAADHLGRAGARLRLRPFRGPDEQPPALAE